MDAILHINDLDVPISASMQWMIEYERATQKDALSAIRTINEGSDGATEEIISIAWAMAKVVNPKLTSLAAWFQTFQEGISFQAFLAAIAPILRSSMRQRIALPESAEYAQEAKRVESLSQALAGGLMRGLTVDDAKTLTYGQWMDICAAHNDLAKTDTGPKQGIRKATQADFDKWRR